MAPQVKFDYNEFNNNNLINVIRPVGNLLCKTHYKVEYIGLENLERKGGFIIAPNHISAIDPLFIALASKRKYYYMAKYELFENPVMNVLMQQMNSFPIIRGKGDLKALNYAIELVRRGEVLCIFPEGTRSEDGTPQAAKSGVGYIARYSGADVIPVAIYTEKTKKSGNKVIVKFGAAIKNKDMGFTDGGKTKENKAAANMIMDKITELWEDCK